MRMGYQGEVLVKIMQNYESLRLKCMKELQNLPPGKLLSANTHGYTQFLVSTKIDGKYKRKSITRQKNLIRSLARAEFLRKEIDNIEQIINLLRMTIDKMHDIDPNTIIASMTRAYRTLPLDYFFNEDQFIIDHQLEGEAKLRMQRHIEWANAPFEQYDGHPEYKKCPTSFGLVVRSKSEQLIAERLHDYGIPFRYEAVLRKGAIVRAPDFTFQAADENLFYWEHAGMMDNPNYEHRHQTMLREYRQIGIVPWDNLIVTYEKEGIINVAMVNAIIKNEIIPRL